MASDVTAAQAIGHSFTDVERALRAMEREMDVRQVASWSPETGDDDLVVQIRLRAKRRPA